MCSGRTVQSASGRSLTLADPRLHRSITHPGSAIFRRKLRMKGIAMHVWCRFVIGVVLVAYNLWPVGVTGSHVTSAEPNSYVCHRATGTIRIDGKLDDAAWRGAPWTETFVDIEGDAKPRPPLRTRVKMLWDDQYFYFAADLEEPHVWATLTQRDSVIFHDNEFEIFLDPEG